MLSVPAPAKLNLTLEVLAKREDGFHEIRSVIQAINLADSLSFRASENIEFKSASPGWDAEQSLVSKATSLLQELSGGSRGVAIEVKKAIPLLSGLGGDSSDAAATLIGLNQFWGLDLSPGRLLEMAWQLGSDVAFFLYGGTALLEGRGEIVTSLAPLPHSWVVLAVPPFPRQPGKTRQLYESLRKAHFTDGQITRRLVGELEKGGELAPSLLFNTFENVAFTRFSELSVYREHLIKLGAADVHLAGSGPALFTLVEDRLKADDLSLRLEQQGLETYLAETLPGIEKTF